jgi:hypothetical protein
MSLHMKLQCADVEVWDMQLVEAVHHLNWTLAMPTSVSFSPRHLSTLASE